MHQVSFFSTDHFRYESDLQRVINSGIHYISTNLNLYCRGFTVEIFFFFFVVVVVKPVSCTKFHLNMNLTTKRKHPHMKILLLVRAILRVSDISFPGKHLGYSGYTKKPHMEEILISVSFDYCVECTKATNMIAEVL